MSVLKLVVDVINFIVIVTSFSEVLSCLLMM